MMIDLLNELEKMADLPIIKATEDKIIINKELVVFLDYLQNIDDDLFIDVCAYIGNDELHKLQETLNSDNYKEGITKFKKYIREFIFGKLNYYQECWNQYSK